MISVTAMTGVSALAREAFGEKVLRQANRAAMLDIELIEDYDCFIPQFVMTSFLDELVRRSGEPYLGLFMVPHLSLTRCGRWGEYILAGATLRATIARAVLTLDYHSRGDRMALSVDGGVARLSYFNAMQGHPGYINVSIGTAGVMLDLFRPYLPADWRPHRIELDIPCPQVVDCFEDVFSCPVIFDAAAISICFDAHLLDRTAMQPFCPRLLTLADVARSRVGPANPDDFLGVVTAQIWAQTLAGSISIESTARALDTSVRSLQRALRRDGTDFRALTTAIRMQRARELLRETRASITDISIQLGYGAPANFARAFRKATGMAPQDYRKKPRRAR